MSYGHSHKYEDCKECQRSTEEIVHLRWELAKYKPPAPLYAIGEVVMLIEPPDNAPVKIVDRIYENKVWTYTSGFSRIKYPESVFRKLTPQEKGDLPRA